jgi:hypothetical protein
MLSQSSVYPARAGFRCSDIKKCWYSRHDVYLTLPIDEAVQTCRYLKTGVAVLPGALGAGGSQIGSRPFGAITPGEKVPTFPVAVGALPVRLPSSPLRGYEKDELGTSLSRSTALFSVVIGRDCRRYNLPSRLAHSMSWGIPNSLAVKRASAAISIACSSVSEG